MSDKVALNRKLLEIGDGEGLAALYRRVFNTPEGELVLQDLKNRAFYYLPTVGASFIDGEIYFNEGKRSVILSIESRLLPAEPVQSLDTGASE
jgi:hypothetical protein